MMVVTGTTGHFIAAGAVRAVMTTEAIPRETLTRTVGGMVMAQVDTWEDGSNSTYLDFFYNVSFAVGPAGTAPNRHDDVMLVQYLLKTLVRLGFWVPPTLSKPFSVDGRMGPDTAAWIRDYQLQRLTIIYQDGRIDRALGVNASLAKKVYTIITLNDDFQFATVLRTGSLGWYNSLEDDVDAPMELRRVIRASRARGAPGLPWNSPGQVNGG
jgi:hypothetical protein